MQNYIDNLNNILNDFFLSIKKDGYEIINRISDIDIKILDKEPLKSLYSEKNSEILILIIMTFISAFFIYFSLKMILSMYSNTCIENIYMTIIKLVLVVILSSNSFSICKGIISVNSLFYEMISGFLQEISNEDLNYDFIINDISNLDEFFSSFNKFGINGVKDIILCSYIIFLVVFFSIRYVLILLCIILSPFSFICILSDDTKFIFKYWLKVFVLNLAIQTINKVIIFIPVVGKREKDIYFTILIGSIYIMYIVNKKVEEGIVYGKNK